MTTYVLHHRILRTTSDRTYLEACVPCKPCKPYGLLGRGSPRSTLRASTQANDSALLGARRAVVMRENEAA